MKKPYLITALIGLCLCSCEALKDAPITIGIEGNHGTYSYSSKGGLVIKAKVNPVK